MLDDFLPVFEALRGVMQRYAKQLAVKKDEPGDYSLDAPRPSPFPQHKGKPLAFGAVRLGRAYVSYHLVPLYMDPALAKRVPASLKKRMQGKACFNFKTTPDKDLIRELSDLTAASVKDWKAKGWA